MNNHTRRLLTIAAAGVLAAATPARGNSVAIVSNLTGTLHVQQGVPCDGTVDKTTDVSGGEIRLTPAEGIDVPGGKRFGLTLANVSFASFSASASCHGIRRTRTFEEIGIQLAKVISFTAVSTGPGVYSVTIPKDQFVIYETVLVNGDPDTAHRQPSEDVTGTIDFVQRTVQMHVVLATRIHFAEICAFGHCVVGPEDDYGTMTTDLTGVLKLPDADDDGVADIDDNCRFTANPDQTPVPTPVVTPPPPVTLTSCLDHTIGSATGRDVCDGTPVVITNDAPSAFHAGLNVVTWTGVDGKGRVGTATQDVTINDTTPPTVTCTTVIPPQGNSFVVAADDVCGEPVIRLGSYVLHDGEPIKIEETGKAGVTLIGLVGGGVRHFHVGKGQAIVTATDSSGNTASAVCR